MAINYPSSLDTFSNPASSDTLDNPSHSTQHANANDAIEALEVKLGIGSASASTASQYQVMMVVGTAGNTGWSTISTLSSPIISNATLTSPMLTSPEESVSIVATASAGTVNVDMKSSGVTFATANATGNWVLNLRGDNSSTANSLLSVGQSISHVYMNTNGTGVFYPTSYTVDGTAVTPRWQSAGTPSTGNANSIDAYAFTIVKTASTPTYTVLASQTRFA
jgi:hypothetical protein